MLLTIGIIIVALWLLSVLAFHITVGFIHLLLVLAVIFVIVHFVRRNRTV